MSVDFCNKMDDYDCVNATAINQNQIALNDLSNVCEALKSLDEDVQYKFFEALLPQDLLTLSQIKIKSSIRFDLGNNDYWDQYLFNVIGIEAGRIVKKSVERLSNEINACSSIISIYEKSLVLVEEGEQQISSFHRDGPRGSDPSQNCYIRVTFNYLANSSSTWLALTPIAKSFPINQLTFSHDEIGINYEGAPYEAGAGAAFFSNAIHSKPTSTSQRMTLIITAMPIKSCDHGKQ